MIIVPNICIFLNTPRTGSRTISNVFEHQIPGTIVTKDPHPNIKSLPKTELPYYTMIRNPYTLVLSSWWHSRKAILLSRFLKHNCGPQWGPLRHKALYPYAPIADKFFVYEKGIEHMFAQLGFNDLEIPKIGVSGVDNSLITKEFKDAIDNEFPDDVLLYQYCFASSQNLL